MELTLAPDISTRVRFLARQLQLDHIKTDYIICFRSIKATSRARARIWSLPRIWQMALNTPAHYCIEVLSQHFDKLSADDQERVLIHELLHIPKNFSGALVPHRTAHRRTFRNYHDEVEGLFRALSRKSYQ